MGVWVYGCMGFFFCAECFIFCVAHGCMRVLYAGVLECFCFLAGGCVDV